MTVTVTKIDSSDGDEHEHTLEPDTKKRRRLPEPDT